jgi:hypothetical protein
MSLYERTATFEYDDYPGLEVVMRVSIPLETHFELDDLINGLQSVRDRERMTRLAELVDEYRVSWTLDGPAMKQPPELIAGIGIAWWRGIRQVPLPLPRRSGDTAPSPEPSTDPESSPEPS